MIVRLFSKALLAVLLVVLTVSEARSTPCSTPEIREKKANEKKVVEVLAGQDVRLMCQVKDKDVFAYWLKNNKTLHTSDHHRMRIKANKYLKIRKAEKADAGFYTCVAVNDCGRNAYTLQLLVRTAPRFTASPEKLARNLLAFPVGNSVKLDCSADGYPRPTVRWYKDGALFQKRKGGSRLYLSPWTLLLTMKDLVPTDTGTYTCNVSNPYGWINHTYEVDVHERVRPAPVVLPMQNVTVYVGDNATLLCKALSDSIPHFQWLRWFTSPVNGSTNSTIEHPHYEVIKQNEQDLNQHLVLPQSNNKFDFHGVKLTLVNVTKKDEGKYTCIVGNAVGYAVEQAYIIVNKQNDKQDFSQKYVNSSDDKQDFSQKHKNSSDGTPEVSGHKGEKPGNKSSGFQYPEVLIGMLVGAVALLAVMLGLFYWKIKKTRARSSGAKSCRPEIDSLRAKHEVQNEYVVVPDYQKHII
ncbi:fibroblast growth factor receptor-like 1 isoform X2 [Oculina patagonica]